MTFCLIWRIHQPSIILNGFDRKKPVSIKDKYHIKQNKKSLQKGSNFAFEKENQCWKTKYFKKTRKGCKIRITWILNTIKLLKEYYWQNIFLLYDTFERISKSLQNLENEKCKRRKDTSRKLSQNNHHYRKDYCKNSSKKSTKFEEYE